MTSKQIQISTLIVAIILLAISYKQSKMTESMAATTTNNPSENG